MGEELNHSSPDLGKIFDDHFPYYLAMGMTYDQFWRDDPKLVKPYRKAWEIQRERANHDAWLQGMYFYEALCDVSPLLHAFAQKGTRPHPYPTKPYGKEEEEQKIAQKNAKAYLTQFAIKFNKSREVKSDASR